MSFRIAIAGAGFGANVHAPAFRDLPGVTPVALALSPDRKTLYAALGDMNAIAVIDVDDAELRGSNE